MITRMSKWNIEHPAAPKGIFNRPFRAKKEKKKNKISESQIMIGKSNFVSLEGRRKIMAW